MTRLTKEAILAAKDSVTEEVNVEEWGGTVLVRGLTGKERDLFEAMLMERRGKKLIPNMANIRAKLIACCCVDDDGTRLFTDQDAEALGDKSGAALDRVYEVAARLSGMRDEDIEELVGDFGGNPGNGSSSSSPGNSKKQKPNS